MYSTGQVNHFNLCASFRVHASAGEAERETHHAGWELNYAAHDPFTMRVRNQDHLLSSTRVLLFNGLESHREIYPDDQESHGEAVVILPRYLQSLLNDYAIKAHEVVFDQVILDNDPVIQHTLQTIMALRGIEDMSPTAFDAVLTELVLHLLVRYGHSHKKQLCELERTAHFPSTVAKARRLIASAAFEEEFGLEELAKRVGMSKFHLIEAFRKATGMTPIRYRNEIRMAAAKSALKTSSKPISEIAAQLGYRDISTFNKFFKKSTGCAPLAYRKG